MKQIKGMIVAPFTAFDGTGAVDLSKVSLQSRFYKDNGVAGAFVCGTTGEGSSLTTDEKKALFEEWSKFRSEDFIVIGFVGGTSVLECQELARHAEKCGLDAIAMTAPYYQKAASVKDLALTIAETASAVPDMPVFYYHIPCLTNVYFSMYDLLKEADALIPNFGGIKFTFENMMDYQMCLEFKDRKYNILWGRDEMMLEALSIGAQGFVGSTFGYNAPIYTEIRKAFEAGDIKKAAELQLEACRLITYLGKYGNGAGKAFMKAAGLDLGPCRRPLSTLSEEQFEAFMADLSQSSFKKYQSVFK